MIDHRRIHAAVLAAVVAIASLALLAAGKSAGHEDPLFASRRSAVLDLIAPQATSSPATSRPGRRYGLWQRLEAQALRDADSDAAVAAFSDYFATSADLDYTRWDGPRNEGDWTMNGLVRTFCRLGQRLSPQARQRMEDVMRWYRRNVGFGGTENHIVNRVSLLLLIDQALGIDDDKTAAARTNFRRWVARRARRGYMEFNSPNYQGRSMMPLLLMYDFIAQADLKDLARKALDQMAVEMALLSIDAVRGGPWHRAVQPSQIKDARRDMAWTVNHIFFGTGKPAGGDPLLPHLAGTTYRPPKLAFQLANDVGGRGSYEVRHRIDTVRPELDAYYYVTPCYSLACFQNRPPFKCNYYGSTNASNLQPWELTFDDPAKVLGVWRSFSEPSEFDNANTANMQYKNVLLYAGRWLDYSSTLGQPVKTSRPNGSELHFFRVQTTRSDVYVGIVDFPAAGGGIIEVAMAQDHASFEAFQQAIARAADTASCSDRGTKTIYTSAAGDAVVYDNGKALVNGKPFALGRYDLIDSPYVNAKWDAGLWEAAYNGETLRLDFADPTVQIGDGLNAEFFAKADLTEPVLRRIDFQPDFNWKSGSPDSRVPADGFSARWSGSVLADHPGPHQFFVKTDGKVRLWVDNKLIVDDWKDRPAVEELSGDVALKAGRRHDFKLEYSHALGEAFLLVSWSNELSPKQTMGMLSELFDTPAPK